MKGFIFQQLCAPNDVNGNPRRLWACYSKRNGNLIELIEEGYAGRPEGCDCRLPGMVELPSVAIGAGEYRSWKRQAKESKLYSSR